MEQYDKDLIRRITSLEYKIDNLPKLETGLLTTWTATVTQGVSVSISSQSSYYVAFFDIVWAHCFITVSGAGTAGSAIEIGGQPSSIQPASNQLIIGDGRINDVSVTDYIGQVYVFSATRWMLRRDVDAGGGAFVGVTPNFALANTDTIEYNCIFRV